MTNKKTSVPPAPLKQIVISREGEQRVASWFEFFQRLSPRLMVLKISDEKFVGLLDRAEANLRNAKSINENDELVGWPTTEGIAFVVALDSSLPGATEQQYHLDDLYFFCLGNQAFSPTYFCWDGDAEKEELPSTFSLRDYTKKALSWEYVQSIIVRKIRNLEREVPSLKK